MFTLSSFAIQMFPTVSHPPLPSAKASLLWKVVVISTLCINFFSLKKAEKSGAGRIILAVYTDNVLPQDGQKED